MSNFLAEATVAVRADTSQFVAQLTKAARDAEKTVVRIKLTADIKAFVAEVNTQLAAAKFKPVTVSFVADLKSLNAALKTAQASAAKGITAPVKVAGTTATGGAAAAATGGARKALTAEQAVTAAVNAGVFARRRISGEISAQEKRVLRLEREEAQLAAAEKAVTVAIKEQNTALAQQAVALRAVAQEAVARTQGQIAREETRVAAPGIAAAQAADAERQRAAARAAEQTAATKAADQRIAATQRAIATELALEKKAAAQFAAIQAGKAAEVEASLQKQIAAQIQADQETLAAQEATDAKALKRRAKLEEQFAAQRAIAAQAPVLVTAGATAVEAQLREQQKSFKTLGKLRESALRAGFPMFAQDIALLQADTAALVENTRQTLTNAEAREVNARRLAAARQATQAQLATFAGLRGAALSAQGAFLAAAAGTIVFAKAIQSAAALESQLSVFAATSGATAEQMQKVADTAQELGRDVSLPAVGASDAAEALTELSKAGLSVQDSISGARGVLQLATAAAIDNAQATELTASALNAFGLAGDEAVRVADVLANSANDSQGSIVDVGIALQQSAAVARQAGLSLEQTVAALTLFARAGLRGSDAGTSLRTALIRLINPTNKAQEQIDKLGLHLRTATGEINLKVFDEFAAKTRDLTAAQRDQALAIIFGQDAIRGAAILARTGAEGLQAQIDSLEKTGTAADLANARMVGLTGAMENLKNQLASAGTALGSVLIPGLTSLANSLADAVKGGQSLVETISDLVKTAASPIEFAVGFVEKNTGQDVGERGFFDRLLHAKAGDLPSLVFEATLDLEQATGVDLVNTPTIKQARKDIDDLIKEINQSTGSPRVFNEAVLKIKELQQGMADGTAQTKEFARNLDPLIAKLQDISTQPDIEIPIRLPKNILSGQEASTAATSNAAAFAQTFIPTLGDVFKDASSAGWQAFQDAGARAAAEAGASLAKSFTQAQNRSLGFSRAETRARIAGDVDAQIQALRGTAAQQRKIIDAINEATSGGPKGVQLERRTKAENTLADTLDKITSLQNQQASDIKQKAQDAKSARDKADQAFLDGLKPAESRLERQGIRAQSDEDLRNDRAVLVARRALLRNEIKLISENVKDTKNARDEIEKRRTEIEGLNNDIAESTIAIQQSIFERQQTRLERRQTTAEQFGDIASQRRIITRRIKLYNDLIRDFKGERSALDKLKDERDALIEDRKTLRSKGLQAQVDLAQSIFDLTGNKNPLLKALNAQIADQRRQIAAAKKAGHSTVALRTALNQMLKARKDLLAEAADKGEGTTAFDLLTEFNAKFNDIAGNLVTPNQPFAGSSEFSTDIVNKAISNFQLPHRPIDIRLRGDDQQKTQISVTQELIAVIRENTDVLRGGGNRTTQSVSVPGEIAGKNKLAAFWAARQARDVRDG